MGPSFETVAYIIHCKKWKDFDYEPEAFLDFVDLQSRFRFGFDHSSQTTLWSHEWEMSSADSEERLTLSTVISRIPVQFPSLPEELLITLLTPLITPHKEVRNHHLLITSDNTTLTAQFVQNVQSPLHKS